MTEDEVNKLIDELLGGEAPVEEKPSWQTTLLECVNRNREVRDENHVSPYKLLLYTEATDSLEAVELSELALRHPWETPDSRWQSRDVGHLLKRKLTLWRQSVAANSLARDGVKNQVCGTVVLVVPADKTLPYSWIEILARTSARPEDE